MRTERLPWQQELEIVDRTMKAISSVTDPEELVETYWQGIGELVPAVEYLALSRRGVEAPFFLITRSSRFTEHPNPWTQRERLPRLSGGILGELIYANRPVIIEDLAARLTPDDPGHFYLQGAERCIALPNYDDGEALNVTVMLLPAGVKPDPTMIPMMHWQAGLFGRGTQNLVLKNQLGRALAALDVEMKAVGAIQRSLLPEKLPEISGFSLAAFYQTSARAGGDYYDFFPLPGGAWGIFIADVSGHGTPAAVVMAITHAIAHAQPGTQTPPERLLRYMNDRLVESCTKTGTFVTAFYAVLDPGKRTLTFSMAGHNPPRLVRRDRVVSLEEKAGLPLGILENQEYGQCAITLNYGDLLLLYTDGITETMSPPSPSGERELFGIPRLDQVLTACGGSPDDCLQRIREEVAAFSANAPPADDQTLIAMRCLA